ncbi:GIY-YIG nuclease family protein [Clostridium vincentii]|uniref:GIY-YIG nuclease superfamily protein n=1 Tax=Clostridium vincentii TaxID=52704 RepID=A0A2T0BIA7_9CLOT|nr:GIY-YIG nuclease family protein [Clostridium vincentii]PRR83618.1 GIY-YIG nuclease superfamily protein [Clostridium vincentii]
MNYVYILKCGDNTLYTGWTNNLEKRFEDHKQGKGAKYTKGRGPLEIVYHEVFENKVDAMKREYAIKKLTRKEKDVLVESFKSRVTTIK